MYQNIHNCKLYIDGHKVDKLGDVSFSDSGNNTLQTLSARFIDADLSNYSLMNKKIEFFLDNGNYDGAPLFRGYIREYNSQDTSVSVQAQDIRVFLTGEGVLPVVIDDKENYDGFTIVQFLQDYIKNVVNTEETIISEDTLKEMDRPVFMTGVRETTTPYEYIKKVLGKKIDDDTNIDRLQDYSIFTYMIDIVHYNDTSGITIRKSKNLENNYDYIFTYQDGIKSLKYKKRAPPTKGIANFEGEQVIFDYGNSPQGKKGMKLEVEGESRGEIRENMIPHIMLEQNNDKEINMEITKCFDIGINNIIHISVEDKDISGNFRVTSKNIKVGQRGISCNLTCNNKPLTLSDYLK